MNKAITDGLQLMPPAFTDGLDVWSSGNGTPGSDTYDGAANAAVVAGDADFGGCLELQKTDSTQRLRYMGETPILPGCYLRVTARVKAMSGAFPTVRIAGWAGAANNSHVSGVIESGPGTTLSAYGEVVEVQAIVGTGSRSGVDMPWGLDAAYGHLGLNLTGANGGVIRVDDIVIEDITSVFLRDMLSVVDVTDFGAVGDGTTNCHAAFEAADDAANGRRILVPEGEFRINNTLSLNHDVIFEGTLSMPDSAMLLLTKSYDYPTYAAAFGDEELAFKKAFQALLNSVDHESLDLGGRSIAVSGPIDMQAAVPNRTSYATRRYIRNGQFTAQAGASWDHDVVTAQATYDSSDKKKLTNVANISAIPVGALVEGAGVGREVYVTAKNVGATELTLSQPLYDAEGTQNFTFTAFKYMLDFSGFSALKKFGISGVEFQCNGVASALRLAPAGTVFALHDCFFTRPKARGITSIGSGCQGMLVDNCQFLSDEDAMDVAERESIALNVNSNDVKLRHNRATRFLHWAVMAGSNHTVTGNHFFQGDSVAGGIRTAGIVVTDTYASHTISENYIDNCFIEWTNEYDANPDFTGGFSFAAMSITDNVFLSGDVASWFSYIVIKPYGSGHFLNGVSVTGNKFRSINGTIDRAERVDTSFATLDFSRAKDVFFDANSFHNVSTQCRNPLRVEFDQNTAASTWTIPTGGTLPFQGYSRAVDAVIVEGSLRGSSGAVVYPGHYVRTQEGSNNDEIDIVWEQAVRGTVRALIRIDR
ncbi:glycosyl hydrolase family 28-related protein [Epibacterium sp. Ofav1-8]|uniref:glycosyl hydrolase family 28-related protein n=1 Tax=Epibacterium sp. Ofav1-8 TaxID=2917735 RepID=UPI001EF5D3B7|nr:glycosyl hydrolase family 28-related protein [Epibacterium sp. Ofav1-8]MCG7624345.1 right-handed parallel beta-helix repeat-containing protein [Epibacterium sp. Ofav1-8]